MKKERRNIKAYTAQFYRGNGGYLLLAAVQMVIVTAGNLLISWLLQQIVDMIGGKDTGFTLGKLTLLACLAAGMIVLGCALDYLSRPRFQCRAIAQYKTYVFSRLSKKGVAAFAGENSAVYISALSNDVNVIEDNYLGSIFVIFEQSLLCVGALALMCWYHPLLTVISIAFAAVPLVLSLLTGNLVAAEEERVSRQNATYMSTLRDSLMGFSVIKAFRAEKQMCRLFWKRVQAVARAKERRQQRMILVQGCGALGGVILQFGVFLVGAYLALKGGALSAGAVIVFVQLLNYVLSPISAIPQALAERKAARALIEKLDAALEDNVRAEGEAVLPRLERGIRLENLSFAYEAGKPVLNNVNFHFETGKSYCLVGASGSGKSTLLNLLMASHADYTGNIYYDDAALAQLSSASLYDLVSVVQQNVFVFNASIRDNMTMFSEFPDEAVMRAIAQSGLSELIRVRGEDYLCGENGSGLSGGEKQRISIARSLLKNAQVLLVDEATAALDKQTSAQVMGAILDLNGLTRIVVTHDLDEKTLRRYDCILCLKNGSIAEHGSFKELMDKKGYFYSLFTVSQ